MADGRSVEEIKKSFVDLCKLHHMRLEDGVYFAQSMLGLSEELAVAPLDITLERYEKIYYEIENLNS